MSHYEDDKTFRTSDGSEVFEVIAPSRPDTSFVVSMDSWDSPEIALRISRDVALALADWLGTHTAPSARADTTAQMRAYIEGDDALRAQFGDTTADDSGVS